MSGLPDGTVTGTFAVTAAADGTYQLTLTASLAPASPPPPAPPAPAPPAPVATQTTSDPNGILGPFPFPGVTISGATAQVYNNVWDANLAPGCTQELAVAGPADWQVTANISTAGNGAVISYPCTKLTYGDQFQLSHWSAITSTFAESMSPNAGSMCEAAYDLWVNNYTGELMVWTDNHNQSLAADAVLASVTLGGIAYTVYRGGGANEYIYSMNTRMTSGTVDLLAVFQHAESQGYIPQGSTLTAMDYGFEISTTGGEDQTLVLSGFTITETLAA